MTILLIRAFKQPNSHEKVELTSNKSNNILIIDFLFDFKVRIKHSVYSVAFVKLAHTYTLVLQDLCVIFVRRTRGGAGKPQSGYEIAPTLVAIVSHSA